MKRSPEKTLIHEPTLAKHNGTCTQKSKYSNLLEKCEISKAMDSIEDILQMDSFDISENNFEDYSLKKVQESF